MAKFLKLSFDLMTFAHTYHEYPGFYAHLNFIKTCILQLFMQQQKSPIGFKLSIPMQRKTIN